MCIVNTCACFLPSLIRTAMLGHGNAWSVSGSSCWVHCDLQVLWTECVLMASSPALGVEGHGTIRWSIIAYLTRLWPINNHTCRSSISWCTVYVNACGARWGIRYVSSPWGLGTYIFPATLHPMQCPIQNEHCTHIMTCIVCNKSPGTIYPLLSRSRRLHLHVYSISLNHPGHAN